MGGGLTLSTDELIEAGRSLRTVATEFEHANVRSETVAGAVGHADLADRVREFAHGWDDRRAKMLGNVQSLAQSCTGIGEAFEGLETDLVAALEGEK